MTHLVRVVTGQLDDHRPPGFIVEQVQPGIGRVVVAVVEIRERRIICRRIPSQQPHSLMLLLCGNCDVSKPLIPLYVW
jgi:hypothetical protein